MRDAGAQKITEEAVVDLEREISKLAEKLTDEAVGYARHAGRSKLIKKSDILLLRAGQRKRILRRAAKPTSKIAANAIK